MSDDERPIRTRALRPEALAYERWSCPECGDYHAPCANEQIARLRQRVAELLAALEGVTAHAAYAGIDDGTEVYATGGLSHLERAFAALGWPDPHRVEETGA